MTGNLGAMTVPAFFGRRYDSNKLKIAAALIIFIFLVPYSASVYTGLAYLFEQVFSRRGSGAPSWLSAPGRWWSWTSSASSCAV